MKKEYFAPKIEQITLSTDDIIRTSQEKLSNGEQGMEDNLTIAGL